MNANLIATQKMAAGGRWQKEATQARAMTLYGHEHDGETIVALGADSLDRRGADARLGGEHFIEAAYPWISGSWLAASITLPSRTTLSTMMRLPRLTIVCGRT